MNRHGQVIQIAIIIIALFVIGFSLVFGNYVVAQFNTAIQDDFSEPAKDFITNSAPAWSFADAAYIVFIVLLLISIAVTYLYIPTHPVLVFVEFIMLVFVVIVGGIISNVNSNLFNDTLLNSTASNYPIVTLVNNNLGFVAVIFGVVIMIAL